MYKIEYTALNKPCPWKYCKKDNQYENYSTTRFNKTYVLLQQVVVFQ